MKNWQRFLDDCIGDPVAIEQLRFWLGRLVDFVAPPPSRMLLLVGDNPPAQRLLLNLLCFIVGSVRCARVSPMMLEQKELVWMLDGCRLNIGDEKELFSHLYKDLTVRDFYCQVNGPVFSAWVKKLLGQDLLLADDHGESRPYSFMPQCALAGSCKSFVLDEGFEDKELMARLLIIYILPEPDVFDRDLMNKLKAEGDLIVAWASTDTLSDVDPAPAKKHSRAKNDISDE